MVVYFQLRTSHCMGVWATSFKDFADFLCFERRKRPIGLYADTLVSYSRCTDLEQPVVVVDETGITD